jgi:hypothetical protein
VQATTPGCRIVVMNSSDMFAWQLGSSAGGHVAASHTKGHAISDLDAVVANDLTHSPTAAGQAMLCAVATHQLPDLQSQVVQWLLLLLARVVPAQQQQEAPWATPHVLRGHKTTTLYECQRLGAVASAKQLAVSTARGWATQGTPSACRCGT